MASDQAVMAITWQETATWNTGGSESITNNGDLLSGRHGESVIRSDVQGTASDRQVHAAHI